MSNAEEFHDTNVLQVKVKQYKVFDGLGHHQIESMQGQKLNK